MNEFINNILKENNSLVFYQNSKNKLGFDIYIFRDCTYSYSLVLMGEEKIFNFPIPTNTDLLRKNLRIVLTANCNPNKEYIEETIKTIVTTLRNYKIIVKEDMEDVIG